MNDLFGNDIEPLTLPLAGASLVYFPFVDVGTPSNALLQHLIEETPWREEEITVWGKKFLQPRLVAWYGDSGSDYKYSGIQLKPLAWTDNLLAIKRRIEEISNSSFNSVLLNYYRNERDSMGFHSDDEPELGSEPTIASYSLGEERTLIFKSKNEKTSKPFKLPLQSGSLLIMSGKTQKNWLHGIEKANKICKSRINLTFRNIHNNK
jgi:alkylated DNA repair dioxygenase AlkB